MSVSGSAILSDDGMYRYSLNRWWPSETRERDLWIMLNPSTADASIDDPTIRRCISFSRGFGSGGLTVVNPYAYRTSRPSELWTAQKQGGVDVVGPECDGWIQAHAKVVAENGGRIIAAWGAGGIPGSPRIERVLDLLYGHTLYALGVTKTRRRKAHPLAHCMKHDRISCWRHRWGKWSIVEGTITTQDGVKMPSTKQARECSRCGKRQVRGF